MFSIFKKKASDLTVGETLGLSAVFTAVALIPMAIPMVIEVINDRKEVPRMPSFELDSEEEDDE